MRQLALIFIAMLGIAHMIYSQVPDSFNYQSVVRNSEGEPVINTNINFQLSILEGSSEGTTVFTETQVVKSNSFGVCKLNVGEGADASGSLADLDWGNNNYYLNIAVDITGATSFKDMGTVELLSVPYALYAKNAGEIDKDVLYFPESDTLFAVKDRDGNIVFAVFPDGAKVYVNEGVKGTVGGFAVTGRNPGKAVLEEEYLRVTPDSTRVWVNEEVKGKVGGFAVTGRNPTKNTIGDYLIVTGDSTRIYVVDTANTKGKVGGFAVTGRNPGKGESNLMDITRENYFIGHEAGKSNTEGLYNSFMGYKAGYSNLSGNRNTFMGYYSGYSNEDGFLNIFIGDSAGFSNTTGAYNVFLGNETGRSNISGYSNIFIGSTTGYNNDIGFRNVFVGSWCGYKNTSGNQNIFMGFKSGWNNTIGYSNIFIGSECGLENINGRYNVFIGNKTGFKNTSGEGNVFVGSTSGYNNTNGFYNVFLGNWCGASNTIGHENIFVGNQSGWYNTEGYKNIFIGSFSGYKNVLGSNNIFLGDSAGYTNTIADNNIFIGNKSGFTNTDGSGNVFLGYQSGYTNDTGNNNIFLGNNSGFSNTSGYKNIFIGDSAGYFSTTTAYNIFIGDQVGYSNTEGISNVIIGTTAGKNNTTGKGNTFIGNWSGFHNNIGEHNVYLGNQSGWNNTSGSRNVYIGSHAGYNNTDGWNNIFIGNYAGNSELGSGKLYIDVADTDSTNTLIWGDFSNNKVRINGMLGVNKHPEYNTIEAYYNAGSANVMIQGTGNAYSYSRVVLMSDEVVDKRWDIQHNKSNVFELSYNNGSSWYNDVFEVDSAGNLNLGGNITPIFDNSGSLGTSTNRWNIIYATNDVIQTSDKRLKTNINDINYGLMEILQLRPVTFNWKDHSSGTRKLGLIAQEVQPIINEVVDAGNDENKTLGIQYSSLVPVLIKGIQEQQKIIETQKDEIKELKSRIEKIEQLLMNK